MYQPGFLGIPPVIFPSSLGTATGNNGAARTTTTAVTLPATASAGQLIIVYFQCETNGAQPSTPAGYSALYASAGASSGTSVFYKIAAGGETSVTVSHGSNNTAWISELFSPAASISAGTAVVATTASPNPPSLSPAGGSKPYAWLAVIGNTGSANITADAANYASDITSVGLGTIVRVTRSIRLLVAATEDPAAFTLSSSVVSIANTVAVSPS